VAAAGLLTLDARRISGNACGTLALDGTDEGSRAATELHP
jgi:hypothetical protein